jgi:ADP-heptose:LPS heptosyltransferase
VLPGPGEGLDDRGRDGKRRQDALPSRASGPRHRPACGAFCQWPAKPRCAQPNFRNGLILGVFPFKNGSNLLRLLKEWISISTYPILRIIAESETDDGQVAMLHSPSRSTHIWKNLSVSNVVRMLPGWAKKRLHYPNTVYVEILFKHLLRRNVDPGTLAGLVKRLDQGIDLREVIDGILSSEEYAIKNAQTEALDSGLDSAPVPEAWGQSNPSFAAWVGAFDIKQILLVKADHIGDFVLAIDAFFLLRAAFPLAQITLLCGPWNEALAKSLGIFDNIQTVDFFPPRADDTPPSFHADIQSKLDANILSNLKSLSFDLAVDLRVDPDSRVLLDHVNARFKCGYASTFCRSPLALELPHPGNEASGSLAQNQRMLMLSLASATRNFFKRDEALNGLALRAKLVCSPNSDSEIHRGKRLVVIQPFSGRAIKNWPLQDFLRLGGWLTSEMSTNTVLLGTKAEAASVPDIADRCAQLGVRSLIGETSLAEAMKVISEADLFIGNDSGLTHIAARLDVPTLALFSGVAPIEAWAPYGRNLRILHMPVKCAPCHLCALEDCPADHICLRGIDLEYVQSQAWELLTGTRPGLSAASG